MYINVKVHHWWTCDGSACNDLPTNLYEVLHLYDFSHIGAIFH